MNEFQPALSPEEIKKNFTEVKPLYSNNAARLEAARCLYCFDAPCIKACPTNINIPHFIQQIANRDIRGSARTIFSENILGGSCGRACPTQELCEGACVYNSFNDKPIQIGRLQRYATDHAIENDIHFWHKAAASGKKVAIVGAGPAGLSCAYELSKLGHACVVFEASAAPGGLNTYGVAGYKIDTEFALKEVEYIKKIGIEVRLNTRIGDTISLEDLLAEYDAVFLGIGLGATAALGIPGEDLAGCMEALEFIEPTRAPGFTGAKVGQNVLIIGGGNTAIDCANAAVALGADSVTMGYRRDEAHMPAYPHEYELAKSRGVQFCWLTAPLRVLGENGRVCGLECQRLTLTESEHGRGQLRPVVDSELVIPCDMVIKALGQSPMTALLNGITNEKGIVQVAEETCATAIPSLFAGGDCINSGAEVVDAVQHGKIAASGIHSFLTDQRK